MKKIKLYIMAVLIALLATGCVEASHKGNNTETSISNNNDNKKEVESDDKDVDNEDETEPTDEDVNNEDETEPTDEEPAYLEIEDTGDLNNWEITLSEMQILDKIDNSFGAFKPDEGNQYLLVSLTVTNNGKESDTFLPTISFGDSVKVKVLYGDGYEYTASNLLAYDREMHDSSINPLSSKEGDIAFSIPDAVASSEDELLIEFTSGKDTLTYKLR